MRILIAISLVMLSGCASLEPFISREQDLKTKEVQKLYRLLENPVGNFEAVREIAFLNNPDIQLSVAEIVSYYNKLASFRKLLGVYSFGSNPLSCVSNAFDYACEVIRKADLDNDPNFYALVIKFEKVKLAVSQKLAEELSGLERINKEINALRLIIKEGEVRQEINRFFENKGFSVSEEKDKTHEKDCQRLEKALEEKSRIEGKIFELCGLVRISGGMR